MNKNSIKKELHQAIDSIRDDETLKAFHTILVEKLAHYDYDLSADQQAEVKKRIAKHKAGLTKSYTWSQVKRLVKSGKKK